MEFHRVLCFHDIGPSLGLPGFLLPIAVQNSVPSAVPEAQDSTGITRERARGLLQEEMVKIPITTTTTCGGNFRQDLT